MKTCSKCRRERPLSDFVNDPRYNSQKHPTCRECRHKATGRSRFIRSLRKYGIEIKDFDRMVIEQAGLCPICACQLLDPQVDHNHETGVVRALLCGLCNAGIGRLRDDPAICISAAMYLFEHEGVLV